MADSNEVPFSFFNSSVGRYILSYQRFGAMNVKLARPSNEEFEKYFGAVRDVMNKIKRKRAREQEEEGEEEEEEEEDKRQRIH